MDVRKEKKKKRKKETKSIHNIWWGVTKGRRKEGRSGGEASNLEQTVHEQREEVFPWGRV